MSPSFSLSGTDEAVSWRELQVRAKFPEYTEVSAPLAARIAQHNADVTKAKETINDAMAAVTEAVAKAESAEPGAVGDVIAAVERCRLDRGVALQLLAESWQRREELAKECIAEFAKLLPPAEKALAAAQEKARADLASIGCSQGALLKAQPTLKIPDEAFDFIINQRIDHVLVARAAVQNARTLWEAASDQIGVSKQGQAETQAFVSKTVRRLAAI